jgi:hypothetical protein
VSGPRPQRDIVPLEVVRLASAACPANARSRALAGSRGNNAGEQAGGASVARTQAEMDRRLPCRAVRSYSRAASCPIGAARASTESRRTPTRSSSSTVARARTHDHMKASRARRTSRRRARGTRHAGERRARRRHGRLPASTLAGATPHSDKLHVVEGQADPTTTTLKREYTAEDRRSSRRVHGLRLCRRRTCRSRSRPTRT